MHQDATWYGGRLQPRNFVLHGDPSHLPKKGVEPPIFGPCLLRPNSCMDQDGTWYGGRPRPRRHCVRSGLSSPSPTRGPSPLPSLRPISITAKRLDGSRWHLARRWALVQDTLCWMGPSCPHKKGGSKRGQSPLNFRPIFIVAKQLDASRCHLVWR